MRITKTFTEDIYEGENDILEVGEVPFDNYPSNIVCVQVRNGDTKEYINEMIEKRRKLKSDTLMDITFGDKEVKAVENCIKAINKMSGNCNEDIVKKIKSTLLKSSCYDKFPYRDVADLLESKATLSEDYSLDEILARNLTPEMIQEIIISQSIYSLREYSYIHPKIKLIINQLNKVPMSLEFQVGE